MALPGPSPADLSPDTQEARGPIPAPLCSPTGLRAGAPPPPARVVEIRGAALAQPRRASSSVHPARSKRGPFFPSSSRVDSARSWEAAVRPARSRRR